MGALSIELEIIRAKATRLWKWGTRYCRYLIVYECSPILHFRERCFPAFWPVLLVLFVIPKKIRREETGKVGGGGEPAEINV